MYISIQAELLCGFSINVHWTSEVVNHLFPT